MHSLKTSRLTLEPFTHRLMLAMIQGRDAFIYESGFAIADDWPNADLLDALPFIAEPVGKDPALGEWSRLLVVPRAHNAAGPLVVGEAGFKGLPNERGEVEIGYGVAASHRGRGYATEAVMALCTWAFAHKGVTRIRAECLPDNAGSIGVLRRSGFIEEGSDQAMLRWVVTHSHR